MKVKELIEILENMDSEMPVLMEDFLFVPDEQGTFCGLFLHKIRGCSKTSCKNLKNKGLPVINHIDGNFVMLRKGIKT